MILSVIIHIAVATQVLDFSYCVPQSGAIVWFEIADVLQMTLGLSMCLLVAIRFIEESLRMYNATRQFQLNRYISLLVREGMIYFIACV